MEIALRGDISFPLLGERCYSTLWGGIGYFIIWVEYLGVEKISRASWVGARLFLFLCRKEISDEISLLGLSR